MSVEHELSECASFVTMETFEKMRQKHDEKCKQIQESCNKHCKEIKEHFSREIKEMKDLMRKLLESGKQNRLELFDEFQFEDRSSRSKQYKKFPSCARPPFCSMGSKIGDNNQNFESNVDCSGEIDQTSKVIKSDNFSSSFSGKVSIHPVYKTLMCLSEEKFRLLDF